MILTFTPNPALDLTYAVPDLRLGASHRVGAPAVRAGGKGVNVARVLHEQGHAVRALVALGGTPGEAFAADLATSGLPARVVPVAAPTRSTLALVSTDATTNLNEAGSGPDEAEWEAIFAALAQELAGADVLVCSGSVPPGAPPNLFARLTALGHAAGAVVVADTSGSFLLDAADAGADVLKPNESELLAAVGGDDVVAAARLLARRSGGTVLASLGAQGMLAVRAEGPVTHARPGADLSGNTTGAGDAAVAAVAAALAAEPRALEADTGAVLRTAVAWSGAAVLAPLAGSLTDPAPHLAAVTLTES